MTIALGVLASGRGSNFTAICDAIERGELDAEVKILISDRKAAPALAEAERRHIAIKYIPYDKSDRQHFEQAAAELMDAAGCDLIILAGFMRILTPWIIQHYSNRMLNIHPSLLPSFKGLHAQRQALDAGVKITGCTVHVVTEDMDAGPIIGQRAVPVLDDDSEESLSTRILEQEHQLYPECIAKLGGPRSCGAEVEDNIEALNSGPAGAGPSRSNDVALPKRSYPAHQPVLDVGNRANIIFLTVCTKSRDSILAFDDIHELIVNSWKKANKWVVGRYLLMPDHIHLFCSPAEFPHVSLRTWMKFWKSTVSKNWPRKSEKPIWQKDGWDTQLRKGDSYSEKWAYIAENPVRAGLIGKSEDWPFQGELSQLMWLSEC